MKNKIITLSLSLILALSSTSALAAERLNYTNLNIYDFFRNYGSYAPYAETETKTETVNNKTNAEPQLARTTVNNNENKTMATTSTPSTSNYERRVAELVNIERQKNGLAPLAFDSSISNVARIKSKDMSDNNYFAHQSPTYGSAGDMLKQHGVKWSAWGENIASGQRTPEDVVNAWMNSEGHRANILSPNFSKIGVGYVNNGKPYWTQMFTN